MNIRIAFFALTVGALVVIGCAGTPVAVDHYGNIQPAVQAYQPSGQNGAVAEPEVRVFLPLYSPGGSFTMLDSNDSWVRQTPITFVPPYNQDGSLTVFGFNDLQIKLIPMTANRF